MNQIRNDDDNYNDVIIESMAIQITSLTIVYTTVCSGAHQRKHQRSASLAFVRGIHRWPVNSQQKWPVARKMFPFDDVIIFVRVWLSIPGVMIAWPGYYLRNHRQSISLVYLLVIKAKGKRHPFSHSPYTVGHRRGVTAFTRLPRWRRRKTRLQVRPHFTMLQGMGCCNFWRVKNESEMAN